jgi:hypothetical protein
MKKIILLSLIFMFVVLAISASPKPALAAEGSLNIRWELLGDALRPGGETTLLLTLENPTTETIYNVNLRFAPGSSLSISPSYFSLNTFIGKAVQASSFKITANENLPFATSYVEIDATYRVGSATGDERSLKVWVPITLTTVPLLQIEDVTYNPNVINPGSNVTISFKLKNYGDGSARDAVVVLGQSDIFTASGSGETFVKEISPDSFANISFGLTIDPSVKIGTYSIPVSLKYSNQSRSENHTVTKYIGLTITGKYNFIVTQDSSVTGEQVVTIRITNASNFEASFLTLSVLPSNTKISVFPKTVYVGDMDKGDYYQARFNITGAAGENVPRNFQLGLEISYQDVYGNRVTEQHTVEVMPFIGGPLTIGSRAPSGGGIPLTYIAIAAVIAAIPIGYFLFRRFRKRR